MTKNKPSVGIWQRYTVRWDFSTPIFGSLPVAKETLAPFVERALKEGKIRPVTITQTDAGVVEVRREGISLDVLRQEKIDELLEQLPTEEEMIEERSLQFWRHDGLLCFPGGNIRAHLKECARTLSSLVLPKPAKGSGNRSLSIRGVNGLYVTEEWVPITRAGQPVTQPDDAVEFFVHTTNPRTGAPMNAIKKVESLAAGTQLAFTLQVLGGIVSEEELDMILQYGALHGFGQERSRGYGRYVYTVEQQVKLTTKTRTRPNGAAAEASA